MIFDFFVSAVIVASALLFIYATYVDKSGKM